MMRRYYRERRLSSSPYQSTVVRLSRSSYQRNSTTSLKLFDALTTPVLEYGCQIWDYTTSNNTEIELIHRKFGKLTLNVPSSATNISIYGELGRIPLKINIDYVFQHHTIYLPYCGPAIENTKSSTHCGYHIYSWY